MRSAPGRPSAARRCARAAARVDARDVAARRARGTRRRPPESWRSRRALIPRGVEHAHAAGARVEAAVDPGLPGEPEDAAGVEAGGVEVCGRAVAGSGEAAYPKRPLVHADDRVEAAIGHPGRTVGPDDHAVRR